ncbi:MAG: response regulator transcription factor [Spirochaetaceae bacterium]|nr:response regulator transcription factor [Spirochaetaceae bacterium]
MGDRIRVLLADDHPVVRRGLADLLGETGDMQVVGEASNGDEAVAAARAARPDVILLDLVMPRKDGLSAIAELAEACPGARILVLTSFSDDEKVFAAIKAGALGYLLKDSSPDELLAAVRRVRDGEATLHPRIALKVMRELSRPLPAGGNDPDALSDREAEVLGLVARGMSNHEIAKTLDISPRTTGKHVSNILLKLHLANRTQAALYALRKGGAG